MTSISNLENLASVRGKLNQLFTDVDAAEIDIATLQTLTSSLATTVAEFALPVDNFAALDALTATDVLVGGYVRVTSLGATYQAVASGEDFTTAGGLKVVVQMTEPQDFRAFGEGEVGINRALVAKSSAGGGSVVVPVDTTFSDTLDLQANTVLVVPKDVTITLDTLLTGENPAIDMANNSSVIGGGVLNVGGNAKYGVRAIGATKKLSFDLEIVGWKYGYYLASSDTVPLGLIADGSRATLGTPHTSGVVYPFQMTNRPGSGGPFCEGLEGSLTVICRDATPGEYSAANEHTADQIVLQGVNGNGGVLYAYSDNGGEVGVTLSRGTNNLTVIGRATAADGHGVATGSAHYPVTVADASGFSVGNAVSATINGVAVTAAVEGKNGNTLYLENIAGNENYAVGATLNNTTTGTGASAITDVLITRNITFVGFNASDNGLDEAGAGTNYAGFYQQRAKDIGYVGCSASGQVTGLLVANGTYWQSGCDWSGNSTAAVTNQGATSSLSGLADRYTGAGTGPVILIEADSRVRIGANQLSTPQTATGNVGTNNGSAFDTSGRFLTVGNNASAIKSNRTGTATTKYGLHHEVFTDGTTTGGGVAASAGGVEHWVSATVGVYAGTGSPEGVKTAGIGSLYMRLDGGASTSLYVKESGTGNTGWVAK